MRSASADLATTSTMTSTVVELRGEIDLATVPLMRAAVADGEARRRRFHPHEPLVIDLSAVTFMDASSVGVLAGAAKRARDEQKRILLRRPSRNALRVLALTGVLDAFEVVDGIDPTDGIDTVGVASGDAA